MSIINNSPDQTSDSEKTNIEIKNKLKNMFYYIDVNHRNIWSALWNNNKGLTPQEFNEIPVKTFLLDMRMLSIAKEMEGKGR